MSRLSAFTLAAALSALSASFALPAFADSVKGEVVAFDRVANVLVLDDKTVWTLSDVGGVAPEGLEAGMTVAITYDALGEDGYSKIESIVIEE